MAETLKYCIPRMQAYAELLYSMNAVTRHGLIIPFSTSARCVFVTQTAICTTKTLAPKGGLNHSKVVIKSNEKAETKETRRQMCHLPEMGQMAHQET